MTKINAELKDMAGNVLAVGDKVWHYPYAGRRYEMTVSRICKKRVCIIFIPYVQSWTVHKQQQLSIFEDRIDTLCDGVRYYDEALREVYEVRRRSLLASTSLIEYYTSLPFGKYVTPERILKIKG